jgi:predicted nucleotidyltransferase component of viral defense system
MENQLDSNHTGLVWFWKLANMKPITIVITEDVTFWATVTALSDYCKNPINEEHGKTAKDLYDVLKEAYLKQSEERFLESRSKAVSGK